MDRGLEPGLGIEERLGSGMRTETSCIRSIERGLWKHERRHVRFLGFSLCYVPGWVHRLMLLS